MQIKSFMFIPPPSSHKELGDDAPEIGLIFIPGAKIAGPAYGPLVKKIQEQIPGGVKVWAGLTDDWYIGGLPNPLQIQEAINDCYDNAT